MIAAAAERGRRREVIYDFKAEMIIAAKSTPPIQISFLLCIEMGRLQALSMEREYRNIRS